MEMLRCVLREEGIEYRNGISSSAPMCVDDQLSKILEAVQTMVKSILKDNGAEMRSFCRNLDLSDGQFYATYRAVAQNTLESDIRWGRIVSLMTFSGFLAARLIETCQERKVESLLGWEREYISDRCHAWIEMRAGWVRY